MFGGQDRVSSFEASICGMVERIIWAFQVGANQVNLLDPSLVLIGTTGSYTWPVGHAATLSEGCIRNIHDERCVRKYIQKNAFNDPMMKDKKDIVLFCLNTKNRSLVRSFCIRPENRLKKLSPSKNPQQLGMSSPIRQWQHCKFRRCVSAKQLFHRDASITTWPYVCPHVLHELMTALHVLLSTFVFMIYLNDRIFAWYFDFVFNFAILRFIGYLFLLDYWV